MTLVNEAVLLPAVSSCLIPLAHAIVPSSHQIVPWPAEPTITAHPQLEDVRLCIVCGGEVTKHLFPSRQRKPWLWCSRRCYRWKPQKVISIEMRFGGERRADIRWILIKTAREFQNLHDHAQALGVSVPYLYTMVKRYFRIETGKRTKAGVPVTRGLSMTQFVDRYARGARRRRYDAAEARAEEE